jgi:hypothetical protein
MYHDEVRLAEERARKGGAKSGQEKDAKIATFSERNSSALREEEDKEKEVDECNESTSAATASTCVSKSALPAGADPETNNSSTTTADPRTAPNGATSDLKEITSSDIENWKKAYPNLDVVHVVDKCQKWCLAKGEAFTPDRVVGWLNRERPDKASKKKAKPGKALPVGEMERNGSNGHSAPKEALDIKEICQRYKDKLRRIPAINEKTKQDRDKKLIQWFETEMPGLFSEELLNEAEEKCFLIKSFMHEPDTAGDDDWSIIGAYTD